MRWIIEDALEAEVTDALGRDYHERGEPAGYRNGNRLERLKTAEGIVEYAVPPVTGTAEPWASEVKQALSGRTDELEHLVVAMYARGWSMRDIEAAFTGVDDCQSRGARVLRYRWESDPDRPGSLAYQGLYNFKKPSRSLFGSVVTHCGVLRINRDGNHSVPSFLSRERVGVRG